MRKKKSPSRKTRQTLFKNSNGLCHWCKTPLTLSSEWKSNDTGENGRPPRNYLTVDHLIAVSDGGTDHLSNLVASCPPCNSRRQSSQRKEIQIAGRYSIQFRIADHYHNSIYFVLDLGHKRGRRLIFRVGKYYFAIFDNVSDKVRKRV